MSRERISVVGAGPGGLSAAMILASAGYEVDVYEKHGQVGGRNGKLQVGDFTFDIGPTFLMMPWILDDVFERTGRKVADYLDMKSLEPFYRLIYADGKVFEPCADQASMKEQIERLWPGQYEAFQKYMKYEEKKFDRLFPCLSVPYAGPKDFLHPRLAKALPYLDAHKSLFRHLGRFFDADPLKLAFTFQAKYLGMSPWSCPATFSIISYVEHSGGVHHPIGGLNAICDAMAKVVEEEGGRIHLSTPVEQVIVEGGAARGLLLEGGERVRSDAVVINADFGHAMTRLVDPSLLKKWKPSRLSKAGPSCSILMLYLGIDKRYDLPHHSIYFADDYKRNVQEISDDLILSEDMSFYIQNACVTDPTLAPEGQSTLYVLVPVPNNRSRIDWGAKLEVYRDKVLDEMERRAGLTDLRKHIVAEATHTPADWESRLDVYQGAVFNLAHTVDQMLYWRPHNAFEEFDRCYLVGGGTHPGSGLPTIYQSGIISADLIQQRFK